MVTNAIDTAVGRFFSDVYLRGLREQIIDSGYIDMSGRLGDIEIRSIDQATGRIILFVSHSTAQLEFYVSEPSHGAARDNPGPKAQSIMVLHQTNVDMYAAIGILNQASERWRALTSAKRARFLTRPR